MQYKDERFIDAHVAYGYIVGQAMEKAVKQGRFV